MKYQHIVLGLCVFAYFGSRVGQIAISPLVPEITELFNVSKGAIGFTLTGMWATYALVQYPAGLFSDRFGERSIILLSLTIAILGITFLAAATTFPLFVLAAFLLGAGVGLYYNAGILLINQQFDKVGWAIGIHRIGGQAAGLLSPIAAVLSALGSVGVQDSS